MDGGLVPPRRHGRAAMRPQANQEQSLTMRSYGGLVSRGLCEIRSGDPADGSFGEIKPLRARR